MSLQSRVGIKEFNENGLVKFKAQLKTLLNKDIQVECDIDAFNKAGANNDEPFFALSYYNEGFQKNCFEPIIKALSGMVAVPIMKEYIVESINTIKLAPIKDEDDMYGYCKLEGGVLTIRALVHANIGSSALDGVIFYAIDKSAA